MKWLETTLNDREARLWDDSGLQNNSGVGYTDNRNDALFTDGRQYWFLVLGEDLPFSRPHPRIPVKPIFLPYAGWDNTRQRMKQI